MKFRVLISRSPSRSTCKIRYVRSHAQCGRDLYDAQVGQVLKEKRQREWSDWQRIDLRDKSDDERRVHKTQLQEQCPGLLTGPHGAYLARTKALSAGLYHMGSYSSLGAERDIL